MRNTASLKSEKPAHKHLRVQTDPIQRILVAEDDADIRRLNTEVLIHYGFEVDAAEDGELAWAALTTQEYDLLITDNNMPKVTGVELLKKMHGARMALPVIMATGIEPKSEFARNPLIVPAALLLKPYTIAELLGTVRSVLHATANPGEFIMPPLYKHSPPLSNHLEL
jgi:DNA-binding response OmpR family regulator